MKILLDQGTPWPLSLHLIGHDVQSCADLGWSQLQNGALLTAAEQAGFNVFVATDQCLKYQQNLAGRQIAIVVLLSTSWPLMQPVVPRIQRPTLQHEARQERRNRAVHDELLEKTALLRSRQIVVHDRLWGGDSPSEYGRPMTRLLHGDDGIVTTGCG